MAVYNLGSINIDHVYQVPHLVRPGETLCALEYSRGLGGKGANQSVAAAKAGAKVFHIGAIGPDSDWMMEALRGHNVDLGNVLQLNTPTGHAIIQVDRSAENSIILFPGANRHIPDGHVARVLESACPDDMLILQNETSAQSASVRLAADMGLRVLYSPAPFELGPLKEVVRFTSLLLMNEGEAEEMVAAFGSLPDCDVIITKGSKGAEWHRWGKDPLHAPAFPVTAVDTTGAGDCFAGTIAAALDAGLDPEMALRRAVAASALQVTQADATSAMPSRAEVDAFLENAP
ncbi:ribokinase [Pseudorhodobacter turbinis]|uniref:Ribokinase n=1 Tax=Pseudorhodobacter turbinis TaxID=2500533 RepID=A0A4P8EFE3_9RHOB|nr:ribokinase [Pseudorhodobacter turbinis]QCO55810.1 ribokinase [Pseudorhodobacter turbinis]